MMIRYMKGIAKLNRFLNNLMNRLIQTLARFLINTLNLSAIIYFQEFFIPVKWFANHLIIGRSRFGHIESMKKQWTF